MSKRGNGEGSISKYADGRWVARITAGDRRRAFYGRTRAQAAERLKEAQAAVVQGLPLPGERLTVAEFLARWLAAVRPTVRETTYTGYEVEVRLHILPALGSIRLVRLSPADLQAFYADRLATGLSPRTVQLQHRILFMALQKAVRWSLVARNVAGLVDAPRVPRQAVRSFSVEQAKAFLGAIRGDRLEALYVVTLATGLRRGEVLALAWDDVDLEHGTLAVRHTLSKVAGGWRLLEPKTPGSRRVIKLPAFVVGALREHRVRQLEERLRLGATWLVTGFVFTTPVGTAIDGDNLLGAFQRLLERAGLPRQRFHDLRHSAATLMLALGVQPKVVAEMLGHSRVGVTLDIYSHVLPHLQDEAAARMDGLLGAARGAS